MVRFDEPGHFLKIQLSSLVLPRNTVFLYKNFENFRIHNFAYIWIFFEGVVFLWLSLNAPTKEYVVHCTIWYYLYNLKNVKNTHASVLRLVKKQTLAWNFTKSNTSQFNLNIKTKFNHFKLPVLAKILSALLLFVVYPKLHAWLPRQHVVLPLPVQ